VLPEKIVYLSKKSNSKLQMQTKNFLNGTHLILIIK